MLENLIAKLRPSILNSIANLRISLIARKKGLEGDNQRLNASMQNIPAKERLLLEISRQQAVKNAIYTFLLQKREEAAISAASLAANYRVLEQPESTGVISPVPKKFYTIGILISLGLVIIYIYFKEFSSKKILFRSQLESNLPVPVVAELIYQHQQGDSLNVVVGETKRTLIAEQFRELRTNVNYITANSKDPCKVILVTSSVPKEGKSFVTVNTAISLSLTGDKVALLEFDLRKPKISKPLGLSRSVGLSNYLIGNATADEILQKLG